jgi:putative transposase
VRAALVNLRALVGRRRTEDWHGITTWLTLCYHQIADILGGHMPWKKTGLIEQRLDLVRQIIRRNVPLKVLCRRFWISRQTAYKWLRRYRHGRRRALRDRSRRPLLNAVRTEVGWLRRVRRARLKHPTWGARKLRHVLVQKFGADNAPATATISRWLRRWGLARGRKRRRRGPTLLRQALHVPSGCHQVWTVDFKGWYRTAEGQRVEPLTVRDLYSRYILAIRLLPSQQVAVTRREFARIFQAQGVPQRIRCDNGTPFGGGGPTGLTRLSAWWVKLGIGVEFITPGRPCENGAHEQFHRVYKAEVARNPERTRPLQQRRSSRWLRHYNRQRPHEALGMKTPWQRYEKNRRRARRLEPWKYPRGWERRWVKGNGQINWAGVRRYVGEAFVRDYVGLKPVRAGKWEVYFGPVLVGELHEKETGAIRMAKYARRR